MRVAAALIGLGLLVTTSGCSIGDEEEKAIGLDASAQVERELPMVRDPEIANYLTTFGTTLARTSDERNLGWRFRVVDAEDVNAFALPGGFVYVNRGLIERASTARPRGGRGQSAGVASFFLLPLWDTVARSAG